MDFLPLKGCKIYLFYNKIRDKDSKEENEE